MSKWGRLIPALTLGVVGNSVLYLIPLLVGAMVTDRGFTESQAGFLASADLVGYALSTLGAALLLGRFRARQIAGAGVVVLAVANVGITFVHELTVFAAVRFVSGVGCGLLAAIATVSLGQEEQPDRNFGLFYGASLLFGTAALWGLPPVMETFKLNGVYWLLVLLAIAALPAVRALPQRLVSSQTEVGNQSMARARWILAATLLAAIVIFLAQQGALWAYMERIGAAVNLSAQFIGFSLGISTLAGFAGAAFVAWAGNRWNRLIPLAAATGVELIALAMIAGHPTGSAYLVACALLALCWNVVNPLQLGILADIDSTGKALALSATATGVGMALGPAIGAVVLAGDGYGTIVAAVGFLSVLSFVLMVPVLKATPRRYLGSSASV